MTDDGIQDNRYLCGHCNSKQDGIKQFEMQNAPKILIISLKRYWWELGGGISDQGRRHKITTRVVAPFMLDTVRLQFSDSYYILMGVAVHSGDATHGHYFSMTRSVDDAMDAFNSKEYAKGKWIRQSDTYIDDKLSKTDIKHYVSGHGRTTPYQYYYKRVGKASLPSIVMPSFSATQSKSMDVNMNDNNNCNVMECDEVKEETNVDIVNE